MPSMFSYAIVTPKEGTGVQQWPSICSANMNSVGGSPGEGDGFFALRELVIEEDIPNVTKLVPF